ncbi:D-hexose-6-phosphate mutarotase [Lonsdalea quercina]|uniref:D-hexose-6-phosphate mutarotase n=1 Tax=Lonsdalea quercina TaxID=71657 RepID=UPI0039762F5B
MTDALFSLPVSKTISPHITLRQQDQLPIVVIDHPQLKAAVALQGAHLIAWQPTGAAPVIWLSDNTLFKEGKAIRGGIPVCFPWFGPVAEPSHGFARIMPWAFSSHIDDADGVTLTLTLRDNEETRAIWPQAFKVDARFALTKTSCDVELEFEGEYSMTSALHSYFNIGDISRVHVSGLGERFIDKVDPENPGFQQGDLSFPNRTDRVYTKPKATSVIHDPVLERTIEVHHHDHSDVVAWNPGEQLSKTMSDITDEGYKTFVCVETARISQPFNLTRHAPAKLATSIRVHSTSAK